MPLSPADAKRDVDPSALLAEFGEWMDEWLKHNYANRPLTFFLIHPVYDFHEERDRKRRTNSRADFAAAGIGHDDLVMYLVERWTLAGWSARWDSGNPFSHRIEVSAEPFPAPKRWLHDLRMSIWRRMGAAVTRIRWRS